jgi:mRNA interferase MazF
MPDLIRGSIWLADLDPVRGHEQAGTRPCLVVSIDGFNRGPAQLVVVAPLTSTYRDISWHVPVEPPEGGVRRRSFIKCEDLRSISTIRIQDYWGEVSPDTMEAVAYRLRILLDL